MSSAEAERPAAGCWNCCHWEHGTQSEEWRAKDRERGYSAECERIQSADLVRIYVGGNRDSWGKENGDSLETAPTFRCQLWAPLRDPDSEDGDAGHG